MPELGAHVASDNPRTLFLPDPERKLSYLYDKAYSLILAGAGYGTFAFANYLSRMPLHAGVWRHVLAATTGVVVGYYYNGYREERIAEKDALLHWYIQQNPELFPEPEPKKKYADLLTPWTPLR